MKIKLKRGLLPHILLERNIAFNKCGVSQQSFENIRDGFFVSDKVISNLESSCGILRNLDFPIESVDIENEQLNIINFSDESLENNKYHFADLEEIKKEGKKINDPDYIDQIMHKCNLGSINKIKRLFYSISNVNMFWSIDVTHRELKDDYFLNRNPIKNYDLIKGDRINDYEQMNDYEQIHNAIAKEISFRSSQNSPQNLEKVTLMNLIELFNESFNDNSFQNKSIKSKNINTANGNGGILEAARSKKEEIFDFDHMEFILDYLAVNGYEFQYSIQRSIDKELIDYKQRIGNNSDFHLKVDFYQIQDFLDGQEFNYLDGDTFEDSYYSSLEDFNSDSIKSFKSRFGIYKNCNITKIIKSNFNIHITLTKSSTTNFAHNQITNSVCNSDFLLPINLWSNNNEILSCLGGGGIFTPRIIPSYIPVLSQSDVNFINNKKEYFKNCPYFGRQVMHVKGVSLVGTGFVGDDNPVEDSFLASIKEFFGNKEFCYEYIRCIEHRNILSFEIEGSRYDSFLSCIMDFYKFSFDKYKDHSEFLHDLGEDIKNYLKHQSL
jgi:hypothetical protein